MKINRFLMIIVFTVLWTPAAVFALDDNEFDDPFDELMSEIRTQDYSLVENFLETNRSELTEDPEYFVILLNYVLSKSDNTGLAAAKKNPEPDDLSASDPKTGAIAGFIANRGGYNEALIIDGIERTQHALHFFDSRLDIHFGIATAAGKIGRWDIVGSQLVRILEVSKAIDNNWTWGKINSMDGDTKDFMIQNILSKTAMLFSVDTPSADESLKKISEAMINFYPEEAYGYANLGALSFSNQEYDLAEQYFKKALKIDPNDLVVLENMKKLRELKIK